MTTTGQLLTYVETKTQAPVGGINNSTVGIPMLNEAMLDLRSELIRKNINASQTQEAYIASVTPPTYPNPSTFAYPSNMYILKTIEVNMTDTTQENYVVAQQVAVANLPKNTSFDWIRVNQDPTQPCFEDRGDTFEVFPTFTSSMNLVNPIKIIYFLQPSPYVTTSDTLQYPDLLDVYILAERVAAIYYQSLNKFNESEYWMGKSNARLAKLGGSLEQGSQQPLQVAKNSYPAGWRY